MFVAAVAESAASSNAPHLAELNSDNYRVSEVLTPACFTEQAFPFNSPQITPPLTSFWRSDEVTYPLLVPFY